MPDIYVKYTSKTGLVQDTSGEEGVNIDAGSAIDDVKALDVTRSVTLRTSPAIGVSELSGSLLSLIGRSEPLHFHMGGHQYISNNAWFDGDFGAWKYEKDNSAAFRWGFRASAAAAAFELDYAPTGETGGVAAFKPGLSMTGSNGGIALGKKADTSLSATFDITGSHKVALAVTGSADIGGGAPDAYFILPRHTNTTRNALTALEGMMIYNTETHKLNYYNGTAWKSVDDSAV